MPAYAGLFAGELALNSKHVPNMSRDSGTILRVAVSPPTGHVFRVERKRGASWYAKYRLPDGRQVQKRLGPAWSERGRPPAGYYTKRLAEDWLRETLHEARHGTLAGQVRTGAMQRPSGFATSSSTVSASRRR